MDRERERNEKSNTALQGHKSKPQQLEVAVGNLEERKLEVAVGNLEERKVAIEGVTVY